MNHFHTRRRFPRWLMTVMIFVLIVVLFGYGTAKMQTRNRQRQMETLHNALTRDITDYYASYGRYPEDLDTIKTVYGLSYDENTFFVDYRIAGANLRPTVVVLERSTDK